MVTTFFMRFTPTKEEREATFESMVCIIYWFSTETRWFNFDIFQFSKKKKKKKKISGLKTWHRTIYDQAFSNSIHPFLSIIRKLKYKKVLENLFMKKESNDNYTYIMPHHTFALTTRTSHKIPFSWCKIKNLFWTANIGHEK